MADILIDDNTDLGNLEGASIYGPLHVRVHEGHTETVYDRAHVLARLTLDAKDGRARELPPVVRLAVRLATTSVKGKFLDIDNPDYAAIFGDPWWVALRRVLAEHGLLEQVKSKSTSKHPTLYRLRNAAGILQSFANEAGAEPVLKSFWQQVTSLVEDDRAR